jgi:hypothetical protein
MAENPQVEATGIVKTISKELRTKSNSKQYSVCTVQITDGPADGMTIFAGRTVGESIEGNVKSELTLGQRVKVYGTVVAGKILWEIATNVEITNDNALLAAFGFAVGAPVGDVIVLQEAI